MADEYIRKDDAMNAVEYANGNITWAERDDCKKRLKELPPADVVQVVRCRDCKYNTSTHKCLNPDSFFLIPKDDDFCSYGERKEGVRRMADVFTVVWVIAAFIFGFTLGYKTGKE